MGPARKLLNKLENQTESEIITFDNIKLKCSKNVFSPTVTHCSKLFADSILCKDGNSCLEIGVGSGYNLIKLGTKYKNLKLFGADFNNTACEIASFNLELNGLKATIYHSNLFDEIPSEKFDNIYFNPPLIHKNYSKIVEASIYDPDGKTLKAFFDKVNNYIHSNSKIYVLYTRSEKEFFMETISKNNLEHKILTSKDVGYEEYTVYELARKTPDNNI